MFTAKILGGGDAHVAYPLVACRYPDLSLPRWVDFAQRCEGKDATDRLMALVDTRGRFHGIFAWRVEGATKSPALLRVSHIATFQLAGNAVHRSFHAALDVIAQEHGCRETVIDPWSPPADLRCISRPGEPDVQGGHVLSIAPAAETSHTLN